MERKVEVLQYDKLREAMKSPVVKAFVVDRERDVARAARVRRGGYSIRKAR